MKNLNPRTEKYIAQARAIHGDKYDYSRVVFKSVKDKVIIGCPVHGWISQKWQNHLYGKGCDACAREKMGRKRILSQEEVLQRIRYKWGDTFLLSKVHYVNSSTKICVTCKKHGDFFVLLHQILKGKVPCPKCWKETIGKHRRLSIKDFKRLCSIKHKNKYIYDYVEYTTTKDKVVIICPEHGKFEQVADSHLRGAGCPTCGRNMTKERLRKTFKEFVEDARSVHGDLYEYPEQEYNGCYGQVIIICKEHGAFKQSATNHLRGAGCPSCNHSRGENKIKVFLQKKYVEFEQQWRVKNEFDYCENKTLIADFYLPKQNMIIEYNGAQHYRKDHFYGGEEQLKKQELRDKALLEYCSKHGINLLVIPYWDFDKIDKILTFKLKQ